MKRLKDLLLAVGVLLLARRRRRRPAPPPRILPPGASDPRSELVVVALLALATVSAVAFVVVYAVHGVPDQTQLLGLCLGLSLLAVAAALIVVGKRLVVTEHLEEAYATPQPAEQQMVAQVLEETGSRFTRGRLLAVSAGIAGGSLGLALLVPAVSLGPLLDTAVYDATPWARGRRLVDERGRPYRADEIEPDMLYTAFPQGGDREALAAPVVVVRLPPGDLALPREDAGYDADGIVAFSKICTHAGCAISLYRAPLFQPTEPAPALVCPCHYSTFDPRTGGAVVFGPAGRKLPMLPLTIDQNGELRAAGTFDEPVGPSWWGVREQRPTS